MLSKIKNISINTAKAVTALPKDVIYSMRSEVKGYKARLKTKDVSFYTRIILFIKSLFNVPRSFLMRSLSLDTPMEQLLFGIVYDSFIFPWGRAINVLTNLTPEGVYNFFAFIASTCTNCLWKPLAKAFNLVKYCVKYSFGKILKLFGFMGKQKKFIMENQHAFIHNVDFRKGIMDKLLNFSRWLLKPAILFLRKTFTWFYNKLEWLYLKAFVPVVTCISQVLFGMVDRLAGLIGVWASIGGSGYQLMQKFGIKLDFLNNTSKLLGAGAARIGSTKLKEGIVKKIAPAAVGMFNGFMGSILGGPLSIGFINYALIKKMVSYTSYAEYIGIKNAFLSIYGLKHTIDAALQDVI